MSTPPVDVNSTRSKAAERGRAGVVKRVLLRNAHDAASSVKFNVTHTWGEQYINNKNTQYIYTPMNGAR